MVNAKGRQRVHDGIGNRRGRAIAAGLADPFDPERMERIGRHRLPQDERRHMTGTRHRVIQQGARERLALVAVAHLFVEGFAESLRNGAGEDPKLRLQFSKIIELYIENLKQLHSVNLGADELAPVFRPEWTGK